MKFTINIIFLLCITNFLFAQKKESDLNNDLVAPSWVTQRPISSSKYIGIGVASKAGNPNYQMEAKKNALYDLTSEIKVNISSNSILYSIQNDNQFSQNFNSLINLKSVEDVEGYELVDVYENSQQYWVYYQLDKQEYIRQKEQKKKNTLSKAAELIKLSINDDNQKNYAAGLRKKIQAFSILVPYLNEEIDFSPYNIQGINNIYDLTKDIQFKLQSISIISPSEVPVIKPYQQKYNPVQVKAFIYKNVLSDFPFSCYYDDDIIQVQDKVISNSDGILSITPVYAEANFQITTVEIEPNIELLVQNDSVNTMNIRFLKTFIQLPKFNIQINIQPINVYIQTKELNLNKSVNQSVLKDLLFNKIKTNEITIVNDSTKADYIIKVISNTNEDDNSNELKKQFNLYLARLNVDITLYNKSKELLFSQIINDVYGYGSTLLLAGNNAYNNEKLINRLNELLFYLKRKIVWY